MTLYGVFTAASWFLRIVSDAIFLYCILSWFVSTRSRIFMWLKGFIDPFVSPFRPLAMRIMSRSRIPFDLSYWFAAIGIQIINWLWWKLYYLLRAL